jgi:hypothetical protein
LSGRFGHIKLEEKGENELDPFKWARGEPGALGPNGVKKWREHTFVSGEGADLGGSCDESDNDTGLQKLLVDAGDAVLLMERDIFDRFEAACKAAHIKVDAHHCTYGLSTSNRVLRPTA